jgi:hypothetical protein
MMIIGWSEQLLVRERELDSQENAFMSREDDLVVTERALGRARMECDAKCERVEVVRQDYRARIRASIAGCMRSLYFD